MCAPQPCLLTTLLSALLVGYNLLALRRGWVLVSMALTPHTLLGSALSLLLVFRTNASFSRMVEARRVRPAAERSTAGRFQGGCTPMPSAAPIVPQVDWMDQWAPTLLVLVTLRGRQRARC